MERAAQNGGDRLRERPVWTSAVFEGVPGDIARARELARAFVTHLRSGCGVPVSGRAMDVVQLVVSELLTNSCKYAPGPATVHLELVDDRVDITVRDSAPVLPMARPADPGRIGQHGLEIVMAVCSSFEVDREPVGKRTTAGVSLLDDPGENPSGHRR
ncbi:ATP-binding protein [Streptomyces ziwulingensis]|uniref:ATP-binding protein n=1 Tax=Streptomyces ziwulingensis TaxID=1045501 RepID=A0ABP9BPY3_9ACTN